MCNHEKSSIVSKKEEYEVLGVEGILVDARVRVCDACGEEILDLDLDRENLRKAYDEYRKRNGLLTAAQIKSIHEKLGISPKTMDRLIQCREGATRYYEERGIQTYQYDMIARLLCNAQNAKAMAGLPYSRLTEEEKETIFAAAGKQTELLSR